MEEEEDGKRGVRIICESTGAVLPLQRDAVPPAERGAFASSGQ